jgi:hypothetical protein
MTYWCSACKTSRPSAAFHRNASRPSGVNGWCKACVQAYQAMRAAVRRGECWVPPDHVLRDRWRREEA